MGTIDDLRGKFTNMATPNRFRIYVGFPKALGFDNKLGTDASFMCKAASIPGETLNIIEVPYQSQILKIAGDRTYDDWNITAYNSESWDVRTNFEIWMKMIHDPETNLRTSHGQYFADSIKIEQLSINDNDVVIAAYELVNAFPTSIGDITLDWEQNDQIETFDVTFAYTYFKRLGV